VGGTHARFAVLEFAGPGREVRRVVTLFGSASTAELFAVESSWSNYPDRLMRHIARQSHRRADLDPVLLTYPALRLVS
jgi:hypothetical protein